MTLLSKVRPAALPIRLSWRLAPAGRVAGCVLVRAGAPALLEVSDGATTTTHRIDGLSAHSQLLPLDDGSVYVCLHRRGAHEVRRVLPTGDTLHLARVVSRGLSLIATPAGGVLALRTDPAGSQLLDVTGGDSRVLADLPGVALGGVWLDDQGHRLAVNVAGGDTMCRAVEVDVRTGSVTDLFSISDRSEDLIVGFAPEANLIVVSTTAGGEPRLGIGRPGTEPVHLPQPLAADGPVVLVALSPDGSTVAAAVDAGARSRLRIVDTATGAVKEPELPPLVVAGAGAIRDGELVVPINAPDRPGQLLHVDLASGDYRFAGEPSTAATDVAVARVARVECLVSGDPSSAETVVLALHGGPLEAWRAMFDPLVAELAGAGIAVVAPNVRGSTGYGRAHAMAIRNDWGGPDLADVIAVGAAISAARRAGARRPVVLGSSYGAYLAVLAAAHAPHLWDGCAALAPFTSGAQIAATRGPVAELVRRLGGESSPDLVAGAARVACPVLVVHGAHDDTVPIAESRRLVHALRIRCLASIDYHELPTTGHDLLGSAERIAVADTVLSFCLGRRGEQRNARTTVTPAGVATRTTDEGRETR